MIGVRGEQSVRQLVLDSLGKFLIVLGSDGRVLALQFTRSQCAFAFELYSALQVTRNLSFQTCL
jgi:hypothetical protein